MSQTKIPFVDLIAPHRQLEEELVNVFRETIEKAAFIGGAAVENFERTFAHFCDAKHCVGVGSGTDALRFALMASGVRSGDIVITVSMTFIATTEAITQCGASAHFVDVDTKYYTLDPKALQNYIDRNCFVDAKGHLINRALNRPVTAIAPVHLYGQMADMDALIEIAEKYNLLVIEDACQAHGAEYFSKRENRWRKAGSVGHAAGFSFYPGKNLGACGEGGAVTTNDEEIARKIRMIRDHGQSKKYYHEMEGYNGRLDALQAAILAVKLNHLAEWNEKRREIASRYRTLLEPMRDSIALPEEPEWSRSVYHLFVILTPYRDELISHLNADGIGTGIHYPIPVHLQTPYRSLGYKEGDLPVSEKVASEGLSLPMFPQLTNEQQGLVCASISNFLAEPVRSSSKARA